MAHSGPDQTAAPAPAADLALLVATESELDRRLSEARERARTTVESAYTDAGERSRAAEQELREVAGRFQAEVDAERDSRTAEMLAEGERHAAAFDRVTEAEVARLAEVVATRLLRGVGE